MGEGVLYRAAPEKVRFAINSPVEEAVTSELVSGNPNSLLAGKIQGILFSGPPSATIVSESRNKFNDLQPNSLRIGTGNLFRPSRELNPAHQGIYSLDQGIPRFWAGFDCGTVNRVSEQLEDEQGTGEG